MTTVNQYYTESELAQAAYGTYSIGAIDINLLTSNDVGMSQEQAEAFASTYSVVDQYNDATSGLSVTLFETISTGERHLAVRGTEGLTFSAATDWLANLADIGPDGIAIHQGLSLYNYLQRLKGTVGSVVPQYTYNESDQTITTSTVTLTNDGALSDYPSRVSVTGHSLGGHLAMMASRLAPDLVEAVYTYNAPGFDTDLGPQNAPYLGSEGFFSALSSAGGTSLTGPLGGGWDAGKLLHVDVVGDVVSSIGYRPGVRQSIFSETASLGTLQGAYAAHDVVSLTDALAVYALMGRLNPSLSLDNLTSILEAASNQPLESLENVVNALGDLLGAGTTVAVDDRDQLYTRIQAIDAALPSDPAFVLTSLVHLAPNAIATAAQSDKGFLYALQELTPFALVGDDALYADLDTADYSQNYLRDRAELLEDKLLRGVEDFPVDDNGPHPIGSGRYGTTPVRFIDVDSDYDVTKYGGAGVPVVVAFGGDGAAADRLLGGSQADRLYGRDGNDTLDGGSGDILFAQNLAEVTVFNAPGFIDRSMAA